MLKQIKDAFVSMVMESDTLELVQNHVMRRLTDKHRGFFHARKIDTKADQVDLEFSTLADTAGFVSFRETGKGWTTVELTDTEQVETVLCQLTEMLENADNRR